MTRCVAVLPAPDEKIKRQVVHPTGEQYPFVGKKAVTSASVAKPHFASDPEDRSCSQVRTEFFSGQLLSIFLGFATHFLPAAFPG